MIWGREMALEAVIIHYTKDSKVSQSWTSSFEYSLIFDTLLSFVQTEYSHHQAQFTWSVWYREHSSMPEDVGTPIISSFVAYVSMLWTSVAVFCWEMFSSGQCIALIQWEMNAGLPCKQKVESNSRHKNLTLCMRISRQHAYWNSIQIKLVLMCYIFATVGDLMLKFNVSFGT